MPAPEPPFARLPLAACCGDHVPRVRHRRAARGPPPHDVIVLIRRVTAQAVSCLGRYGRAVVIGMSPEPIRLTENTLAFGYFNHALLGHEGYSRRHLTQLMRLLAAGRRDLSGSVSGVLPLADVGLGVQRLRTKEGNPVRIVVKP